MLLTLEVVSDVVCPWCFIGLRRLDKAISAVQLEFPAFDYQVRWRPFFLNPDSPPEGEPYLPFLIKKFGSLENVEALFRKVREAAKEYNLDYHFEKIQVRSNTLQAHRLIHWAQQQGNAKNLVEAMFAGQFQEGRNMGDLTQLVLLAERCGYDPDKVSRYLASKQDIDLVRQIEKDFRAMGTHAVPTFFINRTLMVQGAEDPMILAGAIRQVLKNESISNKKGEI